MSVLGKDLFDFQRSHTNTKVEFGASGYWVEMVPEMQPYGTVLTEILNLDVTPFQKVLDRLNTAVHEKNYDDAPRAYMDMQKGFGSLPLYRLYLMDFRYFGDMKIEEFVGEEVREAFAKYVINEEREIPSFMQQQIKDIQLIQERYAWFLDRVFANAVFEKKKGQRKESLAQLIYSSGYEAFVSGVSLGKDPEVDAPLVRAQYRIRGERENAEVVEKMYFDRLLDFVYVELMKGLQKGFVPKRCANCGRWFLQMPGMTYAARIWRNPELYNHIQWDKNAVIEYYGKDLSPAYIPDDLTAANGNGTARVIVDKSGNIVEDTVGLNFYHNYYEDGSPKLTEGVTARKGFSITASKIGILSDCVYLLPENEVRTSDIDGAAVTFGYRSMPYGPYNPDTHEPSGYYDMYVAEFEYDGIEYQIVAEQMEAEEVVKVVLSIICGEEVIVDAQ